MAAFLALSSFVEAPIFIFIWISLKNFLLLLGIILGTILTIICLQIILGLWSIWHLDNNINIKNRYNYLKYNSQAMTQQQTINYRNNLRF